MKLSLELLNEIISCKRPPHYTDVLKHHLPFVLISGIPLLLAMLVPLKYLPHYTCGFLWLTGYPCLCCGYTRAFWELANGDWQTALTTCPLSIVVYLVCITILIINITCLLFGICISRGKRLKLSWRKSIWLFALFALAIIINWIYRLYMGLK